ncbi:GGDEF domain-containing protein [Pseudohongiella sp.]|uniref:GGDEF domain-containing protein n=1 Tax=marine sediment metagenome TaxID=412755 RepID=A0A0F9W593_9ZZZZ|nr:GGDEF domain-containing protein [Pseudohongiella sp.]HDZ07577.1 GGDEF domain-containing protein [Pseudohongiella sp.]HEA64365.1 GGDEF domain-containing protein [Pseudohongiella sp.]
MALQLDITTLVLMFITLAMTSFIVMLMIWRINRDMPGVPYWMVGTLLNTASALTSVLSAQAGWADGWASFMGTSISLLASMLVLEGTLQFRGYDSRRRQQLFLALIPVFLIASWTYRLDPVARDIFQDSFNMTFQLLAGVVLVWRTASRDELQANLLAASASILIGLVVSWRLALTLGGNELAGSGADSPVTQWYIFAGANFHVAWIFGLSVACYFRSRQQEMLLAREDSLTALPNRRWIDEKFAQTLTEARRSGEKFALIILDINDFKQVNDKYGHSAGDEVLTKLATRLRKAVRESDFAGRLGGDEFIILARQMDSAELLMQVVERIRQQLDGKMTLSGTGSSLDTGVSIGAAVFPADGDSLDTLLGAADASMYRDKKQQKQAHCAPLSTDS